MGTNVSPTIKIIFQLQCNIFIFYINSERFWFSRSHLHAHAISAAATASATTTLRFIINNKLVTSSVSGMERFRYGNLHQDCNGCVGGRPGVVLINRGTPMRKITVEKST